MIETLVRCALLRCPECGLLPIFSAPFKIRHHCPACGSLIEREEGFFVGAMFVNAITTELTILAACVIGMLTIGFNERLIMTVLFPMGLLLPVVFYHHSWSVWLNINHLIDSLSGDKGR
jgi:uncharacterized protein (DUF983 family)